MMGIPRVRQISNIATTNLPAPIVKLRVASPIWGDFETLLVDKYGLDDSMRMNKK